MDVVDINLSAEKKEPFTKPKTNENKGFKETSLHTNSVNISSIDNKDKVKSEDSVKENKELIGLYEDKEEETKPYILKLKLGEPVIIRLYKLLGKAEIKKIYKIVKRDWSEKQYEWYKFFKCDFIKSPGQTTAIQENKVIQLTNSVARKINKYIKRHYRQLKKRGLPYRYPFYLLIVKTDEYEVKIKFLTKNDAFGIREKNNEELIIDTIFDIT